MWFLPFFHSHGLQPVTGLIGTETLRQTDKREHLPSRGMHQKERPLVAARLNRHQGRWSLRLGVLADDFSQTFDGCSSKESRQRESLAQPLIDQGKQTHRQQRVPS